MNSRPIATPRTSHRAHFPLKHIVAFFHNRDEEYDVLLPFIRAGFTRGDKAFHIVDPRLREEHFRRLREASIETEAAQARRQLEVKVWQEIYLRSGRFDPNETISMIEEMLTNGHEQGFKSIRAISHMEWMLQDWPGTERFLEYEARLNGVLSGYRDTVVCVYNCTRFDAQTVMDVLRSHPAVMISGVLHHNPFFIQPDELLKEIRTKDTSSIYPLNQGIATENRQVRRMINEVVALSTLPAEWAGREPNEIAEEMLSILMHYPRVDAAHVRLRQNHAQDVARTRAEGWPQFEEWLKTFDSPPSGSKAISEQRRIELSGNGVTLYVLQIPIGLEPHAGWIALGSVQADFPDEVELMLLTIAANQGLISFQNARLLYERDRVTTELEVLKEKVDSTGISDDLLGSSPSIRSVISQIGKVAPTDSTVLITGETGTGKELAARAIHKRSRRAQQPFVSVNCAALPATLIASELFGHERGAFTGAELRRLGRFELANCGTLFLDEIGELSLEIQATLLRVLQERVIERLGGAKQIRIDVRLIAATNRDLKRAVDQGTFRSDLYYRLHVFPIEMPPLRDRKEDIPLLTRHFITRCAATLGKKITRIDPATIERFQAYPWPGNIRELQNVVERSLILCEGDTFTADGMWSAISQTGTHKGSLFENVAAYEREMIENALRQSAGKVSGSVGAARRLGIPSTTLESRIKALNINKNRFRA
jgi:transcriptional regulator with GAF, ATPase, and Fis domain